MPQRQLQTTGLGRHAAASGSPPVHDPGRELSRFLRLWRERLDPEKIPGVNPPRANPRKQVSQELAALHIGCSLGWLGSLERGNNTRNYSPELLERVARVYQLDSEERRLLYLLAAGHEPPARIPISPGKITHSARQLLDAQRYPAFISDEAWNLVAHNRYMQEWFPWVSAEEGNFLRWAFTYPEARQKLHHWDTEWAPYLLAEMRFSHAKVPSSRRINAILDEVLRLSPEARRMWEDPVTYPHVDGLHRKLCLPGNAEPQTVEIIALSPLRATHSRVIVLMPIGTAQ